MKITYSEQMEDPHNTLSVYDFLMGVNSAIARHSGRIEGEVTSVKATYATAIYFTIKDTSRDALLNCVIWRSVYNQNGVVLKEGDTIIVTGTPEIYVQRGSFSLKVQTIEYAGEGALKKAYDELRAKLAAEGLLSPARKRLLPMYPQRIGVITSRSGVVIQDFSSNLGRYGFQITMVDSRVEGKDAIHELLAALKTLAKQDIEILVIMRGGGSWESLQAFNTESVVRAIASFNCPVLTGIGHDVDVTLAELVSDVGSSTPTAVAERLNESWDTLISSLESVEVKVMTAYQRLLTTTGRTLESDTSSLCRRGEQMLVSTHRQLTKQSDVVSTFFRRLEKNILRARGAFQSAVGIMKVQLKTEYRHLDTMAPMLTRYVHTGIVKAKNTVAVAAAQIVVGGSGALQARHESLLVLEKTIRLSDPERNLKLGYSLSYANGKLLRSVTDVPVGEEVTVTLTDGTFTSVVKAVQ